LHVRAMIIRVPRPAAGSLESPLHARPADWADIAVKQKLGEILKSSDVFNCKNKYLLKAFGVSGFLEWPPTHQEVERLRVGPGAPGGMGVERFRAGPGAGLYVDPGCEGGSNDFGLGPGTDLHPHHGCEGNRSQSIAMHVSETTLRTHRWQLEPSSCCTYLVGLRPQCSPYNRPTEVSNVD
jgi:hypothetical protein